jgi:hypothetical protein
MTAEPKTSVPNVLMEQDRSLFDEIQAFRARFEDILLADVDRVLDDPRFRDRGNFLPLEDTKAIARVIRVLTKTEWTLDDLDCLAAFWRDAMRSDFFAEAFESIRFRVENAVNAGRSRLNETNRASTVTQGTLW